MITKADYGFVLKHYYGGNGFAVLEDMGNEYMRVVSVGGHRIGHDMPIVWVGWLERDKFEGADIALDNKTLELLEERRKQLGISSLSGAGKTG